MSHDREHGVLFWAGVVIGAAIVAYGLRGVLTHMPAPRVRNLAFFLGGSGVVHDAVWAPLVVAAAFATRALPAWTRTTVRVAGFVIAAFVVFTWPVVRDNPRRRGNPSILPLDYGHNLRLVIAAIVVVAALDLARRWRRRGRLAPS
jgi:hypothetical protein